MRTIWLQRINNQKLFEIDDITVLRMYKVCDVHFASICKDPTGKLLRYALPTERLPGKNL